MVQVAKNAITDMISIGFPVVTGNRHGCVLPGLINNVSIIGTLGSRRAALLFCVRSKRCAFCVSENRKPSPTRLPSNPVTSPWIPNPINDRITIPNSQLATPLGKFIKKNTPEIKPNNNSVRLNATLPMTPNFEDTLWRLPRFFPRILISWRDKIRFDSTEGSSLVIEN